MTWDRVHQRYVEWFVESKGFGMERIIKAEDFLRNGGSFVIEGSQFRIAQVTLLSLLKQVPPVAYELRNSLGSMVHSIDPIKPAAKDAFAKLSTRALTPFETKALEEIRLGKGILVKEAPLRAWSAAQLKALSQEKMDFAMLPKGWVMAGALRATTSCIKCHDVEDGDLLGVLSYSLVRRPFPPTSGP